MESIMICDEIEVTVCGVVGDNVKIGIEAPRSVPVFRKEIYLDIQRGRAEEVDLEAVEDALNQLKSG